MELNMSITSEQLENQRQLREASKNQKLALQQIQSEAYSGLLMNVLERATKVSAVITVVNGSFIVSHRQSLLGSLTYTAELTYNFCPEAQEELNGLTRSLQSYEQELAEEQRKTEVKASALAKLTAEERKLLGL